MNRFLFILALLVGILAFLPAEGVEHSTIIGSDFAYYFDNNEGYGATGGFLPLSYTPQEDPANNPDSRTLGSGWGSVELKAYLTHRIRIPFLQGDNPLVSDNNATVNLKLNVAPVAVYGEASVTITPIAFLNFDFGGMIGSGWNAEIFNGVGDNINGDINTDSFPGVVGELWSSATFQFDLAALVPGEWTHVVTQLSGKFLYSAFTSDYARNGGIDGAPGPWQWLADSGENLNGWKYKGSYFLGYQMPLVLDTVGFLVETSQAIGPNSTLSTMAGNGWGSDFTEVTFGPLVNLAFNEHNSLAVLVQFQTGRDYTDATIFEPFYQDRVYEDTYTKFHRIALSYNYKF